MFTFVGPINVGSVEIAPVQEAQVLVDNEMGFHLANLQLRGALTKLGCLV